MRVEVAPEIGKKLRRVLRSAGRRETGGILFAEQLAPAHFRVIDLSVDDRSGSNDHFMRDPHAHERALHEFFARTGNNFSRFNYLGEWHSHPSFAVTPSMEDIATMTELVSERSSAISFAVLLIVRIRFRFLIENSWTVFARGYSPEPIQPRVRWI